MSFRSALKYPSSSCGNIGAFNFVEQSGNIPLVDDTSVVSSSMPITKGVWSITQSIKIYIPAGTTINELYTTLQYDGLLYLSSQSYESVGTITTTDIYKQETNTITINVFQDGMLYNNIYSNFTAGAGGAPQSYPPQSNAGSIYAIKLA